MSAVYRNFSSQDSLHVVVPVNEARGLVRARPLDTAEAARWAPARNSLSAAH